MSNCSHSETCCFEMLFMDQILQSFLWKTPIDANEDFTYGQWKIYNAYTLAYDIIL